MKHTIGLEHIGQAHDQQNKMWSRVVEEAIPGCGALLKTPSTRPWIAEIVGLDVKYKFKREFIQGKTDYSKSNSKGTRGVVIWFIVEDDKIYQIYHHLSWKRSEKYYCKIVDGKQVRMSEEDVSEQVINKCLKSESAKMY